MVYTSNYDNAKGMFTVSVSGDRGKGCGYEGLSYPELAPKKGFWKAWHDNIGKIPEIDNNRFYIREYIKQVLSELDPYHTYRDLDGFILLCYEDPSLFCHRHIIAAWLDYCLLGECTAEVKQTDSGLVYLDRPAYIKEIFVDEYEKIKRLK